MYTILYDDFYQWLKVNKVVYRIFICYIIIFTPAM